MIQRIKDLLKAAPFVPFKIRTSDGREFTIPTPDHAAIPPEKFARVIVFDDAEHETHLSVLHIVGIESTVVTAG
jgi:hypothetical protein